MEFCTAAKGLDNQTGENNCFLNVVFQVFAHLPTFKRIFHMFTYEHVHERSLLCLLCEIREDQTLDPSTLRHALAVCIEKFEKNKQACPVELFENLLDFFHSFSETCPARCASHSVFGYEYCEETSCNCQKSFGDKMFDCVVRTYAAELFQLSQNMPGAQIDVLIGLSLASQAHTWPCTSCGKVKYLKKLILQKPKVLIISISWTELSPRIINWLAESIMPVLLLRNLFSLHSEQPEYYSRYVFKGLVCFALSHYVSFFYSLRRNQWIMFDDSKVKMMDSWTEVFTKLVSGKMKPVLLIYELDTELDKVRREYQLDYIENEHINYLLDPDAYFESFNDVLALDLAGLTWKSDVLDVRDTKKCRIF